MKNGVDLRQKIIDTAWELFYKNGYENTTVNWNFEGWILLLF